jgi:hypothetical protein
VSHLRIHGLYARDYVCMCVQNRDKVRANAVAACERLGKYRMPFAWTAIYVMNIINGINSLERDSGSDKESTGSNSLGKFWSENYNLF